MLYAGSEITPFYVHALVLNSYLESSWRVVDGASNIAKQMAIQIHKLGGKIWKRAEVIASVVNEEGCIDYLLLKDGRKVSAKNFISNAHPAATIDMIGENFFKKSYVSRIKNLKNTESVFVCHIVFKPKSFPYINHNIFQVNQKDVWNLLEYDEKNWPAFYMFTVTPSSRYPEYAGGASVICGMGYKEVEKWKDTFNTVTEANSRGEEYENFKKQRELRVLEAMEVHFPGFKEKVQCTYSSTPLTQRDYTNIPQGSAYGIEKDSNSPFTTFISPRTNIPNLYLTGQNLNLHGILGVTLTALVTCFHLTDKEELLKEINSI
jgi:all-trans-retinol 13,14-reductase